MDAYAGCEAPPDTPVAAGASLAFEVNLTQRLHYITMCPGNGLLQGQNRVEAGMENR